MSFDVAHPFEDGRMVASVTDQLPSPALKKFLSTLRRGEVRSGVVVSVEQFGVLVDLDGAPESMAGIIPLPEVSWQWLPSDEVLAVGQRVTAEVLDVESETRGQAVLSLIALQSNPWLDRVDRVGSVLTGRVTKVVPFGVFVGVDDGMSGLVHISELPRPCESFRIGDELTVQIAEVEPERRRIRLALPGSAGPVE
ncbi:S1 RNA-binding domain-containing protein [Streptacidiphilus fuscans]|uniref:S1 RNA-binding domain-containing protein n=1 Tax=Streptacidiphilus fuscans TaxID=2789292 RepID=A0A931B0V9_9ACTN|nr:S1 RNA-binding domain-containing protein [Streptacidiphilus fuscans]MBF9069100.1 S1 RNA-binding domain-containing protein [Streptacidiphilus fuscans]